MRDMRCEKITRSEALAYGSFLLYAEYMKTPSPALAVSTLALAVALTGTAGAASGWINGNRIKPHSITAKQIKTHAITKATLADGITDPAVGPAGPKGDAGPAGPPGLIDRSKLVAVAGADVSLYASSDCDNSGTVCDSVAACPAGAFLIGGGYTNTGTARVLSTGPAADGSQAWVVHAHNESTLSQAQPWHAIAYCVVSP